MRMLADRPSPARVETADAAGWSTEAIEAQAFAYLAVRSLRGLPISLPSTNRRAASAHRRRSGACLTQHGAAKLGSFGRDQFAAASFSGSLTLGNVANSTAHGAPFTFSTLRI
jgi:hypothetical protein